MSRWHPKRLLQLVAALACSTMGCAESVEQTAWTVRDSAEVRIVESLRPAWGPGEAWLVADAPTTEIGVEGGEDPYILYQVSAAVRLDDGRIVIANAGSGELRFFDAAGRFLYAAGRRGQGPGEFGDFGPTGLWRGSRNVLIASDGVGNNRVNFFQPTGEFVRSVRIEPVLGRSPPSIIGVLRDGTWLAAGAIGGLGGEPGQILQGSLEYSRYNANGRPAETLFELTQPSRYVHSFGEVTHYPYLPLQTRPSVAAGDYWLYIGNGQAPMIERRRLDGSANSIYRWVEAARRPAAAHYERYREEDIASASEGRRPLIAHYYREDLPLPEHLPVYQGLFVDDLGYLWVEQYRLPWEDPPQWEIFDPEGRWLGRVTTPRRFRLYQIGRDFILGRHRDEIGVERVRLYSLLKPEGGD